MKQIVVFLFLSFSFLQAFPQQGQLGIARVGQMPDLPAPLMIRDWKKVAMDYDSLVFNMNRTGDYLPLSRLGTQGQFNYPDNTAFFLDSYVGADSHLNQAEAINILPAIVGASLVGIDKSNQQGMNLVSMTKDFFNLKNGQNVYLNGYFTTSGSDWWYDVMPNVYFYQLRWLYPGLVSEFESQFIGVADRWLGCVNQLGGGTVPWKLPNMNYRAFNLITGRPLAESVPEPESAGSIAWLLYQAYIETGNKKYFTGAQLAMEFLAGLTHNPSYELQLPYGTMTAARMNAVEGTDYPLQKMLDWCFNRGDLRGWGSIVGKWGGYDVSGLIGEANDGGDDYAFVMNGFQQAAALAPLPRYDKRYARAIAKWILNLTNASRLFYRTGLPENQQDAYGWSVANDPLACIPYESMKQVWVGKSPFATGDALRGGWAATNLSLYSGSSVGYLAAVVKTTNIPEILQIDLNKTDFYSDKSIISRLYFNPTGSEQSVNVTLPAGTFGVYEAITEEILYSVASATISLLVPAGEVRMISLYPSGIVPFALNGRLYAGDAVLDYHYRYNYSVALQIKSLATDRNPVVINSLFNAFCEAGNTNPSDTIHYEWFMNYVPIAGKTLSAVQLTAPAAASAVVLRCRINVNEQTAEDTIHLLIVDHIALPPVVTGIQSAEKYTATAGLNTFTALVEPVAGEILTYTWSASSGSLYQTTGGTITWQAPVIPGIGTLTVSVTNSDQLSTTLSTPVLVKDTAMTIQQPLIWYPFDQDDRNAVANRYHATATGVVKTADPRGEPGLAYRFLSGQNIIFTENSDALNFTDAVSLSCWVNCEELGSERFILSHGSWQQRYKLSITPEGRFRWTVKTTDGIADLDATSPIEMNSWYHVTVLYTGYSLELYIDGKLDSFKALTGAILPSTKPFTIGRMDEVETLYALRGSVDEVKLWDREIPVKQIEQLKNQWALSIVTDTLADPVASVWPNPVQDQINLAFTHKIDIQTLSLFAADGRKAIEYQPTQQISSLSLIIPATFTGLHLIRLILKDGRVVTRKVLLGQ